MFFVCCEYQKMLGKLQHIENVQHFCQQTKLSLKSDNVLQQRKTYLKTERERALTTSHAELCA